MVREGLFRVGSSVGVVICSSVKAPAVAWQISLYSSAGANPFVGRQWWQCASALPIDFNLCECGRPLLQAPRAAAEEVQNSLLSVSAYFFPGMYN